MQISCRSDHIKTCPYQRFVPFLNLSIEPDEQQHNHFIQSLIFPILTYDIELWNNSANQFVRDKLLKPFDRNNFDTDINKIFNIAKSVRADNEHILNVCYEVHRKLYQLPRVKTTRFLASFIPRSMKVLNGYNMRACKS